MRINPEWKPCLRTFARVLLERGSITENELRDGYGYERAAARAHELRKRGWPIATVKETRGRKRYARYVLR